MTPEIQNLMAEAIRQNNGAHLLSLTVQMHSQFMFIHGLKPTHWLMDKTVYDILEKACEDLTGVLQYTLQKGVIRLQGKEIPFPDAVTYLQGLPIILIDQYSKGISPCLL